MSQFIAFAGEVLNVAIIGRCRIEGPAVQLILVDGTILEEDHDPDAPWSAGPQARHAEISAVLLEHETASVS